MSFNGKPNETGEAELMEDDLEESTMEVENQVTVDLFTDHRTTAMSETNEAGEVQNITGKPHFFPCTELFCKNLE